MGPFLPIILPASDVGVITCPSSGGSGCVDWNEVVQAGLSKYTNKSTFDLVDFNEDGCLNIEETNDAKLGPYFIYNSEEASIQDPKIKADPELFKEKREWRQEQSKVKEEGKKYSRSSRKSTLILQYTDYIDSGEQEFTS